jgi:polar amino acid transport system permease protein
MISTELLFSTYPLLFKGALSTLEITANAMAVGMSLGGAIGVARCKKLKIRFLSSLLQGFVWIIRGTPLFIQLFFVYYALPDMLGWSLSPFSAGVVALGLNSAVYTSEIVRGAIDTIPDGQWEAAYAVGLNVRQTIRGIIFPQMLKPLLPGLTNELSSLIKETSILMAIGTAELTKVSKDIVVRELDPVTIYIAAACLYLCFTTAVSVLTGYFQRKVEP